jgi:hypothetical protein
MSIPKHFGILLTSNAGEGLIMGMLHGRMNLPGKTAFFGVASVAPYMRALV